MFDELMCEAAITNPKIQRRIPSREDVPGHGSSGDGSIAVHSKSISLEEGRRKMRRHEHRSRIRLVDLIGGIDITRDSERRSDDQTNDEQVHGGLLLAYDETNDTTWINARHIFHCGITRLRNVMSADC